MLESVHPDVAHSLANLTGGDDLAAAHLMELIYEQLRRLAGHYFQGQRGSHTLQPTALVHEAFVKVTEQTGAKYQDRSHFFAVCALAMRQVLADHARRRRAAKRGPDWGRIDLGEVGAPGSDIDALALDEALSNLAERCERQARVVEYRFFAGMNEDEIAHVLGVSRSTVQEDWRSARAWLMVRLRESTL